MSKSPLRAVRSLWDLLVLETLLVTGLQFAEVPVEPVIHSSHPMDSSQILLTMMALSRQAEVAQFDSPDSLDSVIARPVLKRLISALSYRDEATLLHSRRVALLSVGMAQQLGWDGRHLRVLEVAALLHDIGKIGVPDNVLLKPGKLSPDEEELMSTHHRIGADILQACRLDKEVIQIMVDAHAYYDLRMNGVRSGRSDMHLGARIMAVADAYDSLTHDQVFRTKMGHQEAMRVLHEDAGTKFDGNVVAALARWVENDGLPYVKGERRVVDQVSSTIALSTEGSLEAGTLCHVFSYLYTLETLYDGFYVLDPDLRFAVWSSGAEQLLGRSSAQMLGQAWTSRQLSYRDKNGKPLTDRECPIKEVTTTSLPVCRTLQIHRRGGGWLEAELQAFPLLDRRGSLQGVAEIFRDVTRTKRNSPQFRELKLAASRDALTGVANRGELERQLKELLQETEHESNGTFSLLFLDIDHFKSINDTHGHSLGDRVLIAIARLLQSELYSGELVARYGGEEFVILCPATDLTAAARKAERLRTAVMETTISDEERLRITASLGVAQWEPGDTAEGLMHRADSALYQAKEKGRNRTCQLTRDDLEPAEYIASDNENRPVRDLTFSSEFTTCMMSQMAVYKVSGFVREVKAHLKEVSEERVVVQIGDQGLFRRWGNSDTRRPVMVVLDFSEPDHQPVKAASKRVLVRVTITPVGRPGSADEFERRAKRVFETTRCHFAAD
ncbi:MAG: diguanylate cyclase [Planctomycetaceae bacterium]|nr:diguanylate cyclase [Planctomycetaceae bacterium]